MDLLRVRRQTEEQDLDERYKTIRTIVEHLRSKDAADSPIITEAVAALACWDEEKPYKQVPLNELMFESVILRTPVIVTLPVDFAAFDADPSLAKDLMSGFVWGAPDDAAHMRETRDLANIRRGSLPCEGFDERGLSR